jgi:hypothetical protein
LASTPPTSPGSSPNPSDAFIREVDEQLRLDQALGVWKNYGRWIIAAVIAALALFAGWLWWDNAQETKAGVEGEELSAVLNDLSQGKIEGLDGKLTALAESNSDGISAAARITQADLLLTKNDTKGAAAMFGRIAADDKLAQPYRDMALVRQTATEFDSLSPDAVVARLKPLAAPGNPWFGSAGEMVGISYMKQGKTELAGATFAAIAKDETVPESIRSRVVQLASAMGVDAAPATQKGVN